MSSITINGEEYHKILLKEKDIKLLEYALTDYRGIFKEDSETGKRLDNIIKILDKTVNYEYSKTKENAMSFEEMLNEKEEQ